MSLLPSFTLDLRLRRAEVLVRLCQPNHYCQYIVNKMYAFMGRA
jgi:hypothetical protein